MGCEFRLKFVCLGVLVGLSMLSQPLPASSFTPEEYETDVHTVLLDHFNGGTLGTPSNVAFEASFPWLGDCAVFDGPTYGVAAYIQYSEDLLSIPNGTVELWIWLDGSTQAGHVIWQGGQPPQNQATFSIGWQAPSDTCLGVGSCCIDPFMLRSGAPIPLRTWTHVAVTWGSRGAELWINGILDDTDPTTGYPSSGYAGPLTISGRTDLLVLKVDELRVSNVQRPDFPTTLLPTSWGGIKAMYR